MLASRTPVIVGVAQLRSNRERRPELAREPLDLITTATLRAAADAGPDGALLGAVDRLEVVRVLSWSYRDLAARVADKLGLHGVPALESGFGGQQPAACLDRAAARIWAGETDVEIVCGGESFSSAELVLGAQGAERFTHDPGGPVEFCELERGNERCRAQGLIAPIRVYPLYENRLRFELGETLADAQAWSGDLYADFSHVAATQPAAWNPERRTREQITTVHSTNRMICFPYPLLLNAHLKVDQAAAVVVASAEKAQALRIVESRWVYVWGGAGATDPADILERGSYGCSPALEAAIDGALGIARLAPRDLAIVDLYSCFPVVPKLGVLHLGLGRSRRVTTAGGLSSFGGPGNNYSLHAIVAAAAELRRTRRRAPDPRVALIYGNGEYLTKHHALLLADAPHAKGFLGLHREAIPRTVAAPPVLSDASGQATVETYTVEYGRDGAPRRGFVIGRLLSGPRFAATVDSEDPDTLAALVDARREPIGRRGIACGRSDGKTSFRL